MPQRRYEQRTSISEFFEDGFIQLQYCGLFSPCWIWKGGTRPKSNGSLYAAFRWNGSVEYVHRIFLFLEKRIPIKSSYESEHLCHKSLCVNPNHIIPGNHSNNIKEMHRQQQISKYGQSLS